MGLTDMIVRKNARKLSKATGIPVEKIAEEIIRRRITPGDWAIEHGLSRITFS